MGKNYRQLELTSYERLCLLAWQDGYSTKCRRIVNRIRYRALKTCRELKTPFPYASWGKGYKRVSSRRFIDLHHHNNR